MAQENIKDLTDEKLPSILGLNSDAEIVIGDEARKFGLRGHTNTYHFKADLGSKQDDSVYEAKTSRTGAQLPGRTKPYWIRSPGGELTETLSPMEATREFISRLIPRPENSFDKIIIGEPTLDEYWLANYRKNVTAVLKDLGYQDPIFFPEPFAVYQYFRQVEKKIKNSDKALTTLVIDFGGGTFDCCVIRTNKTGELGKAGAHQKPLGTKSSALAGESVDVALLEAVVRKAKVAGAKFKDDPIQRAKQSARSMWIIEDVKIALSNQIGKLKSHETSALSKIKLAISLPAGTLHPTEEVSSELNGDDLWEAIKSLWDKEWGRTVIECHRQAEEKLGEKIVEYDYILLAGGSAQLPFLEGRIRHTLPVQTEKSEIVTGGQGGSTVAKGIAVECMEQADKHPTLVKNRLVNCLENNLYIRAGRSKSERIVPKIKGSNFVDDNSEGLIYRAPGIMEKLEIECTLELKHQPKGVLHYWFNSSSQESGPPQNPSTSIRIRDDKAVDRKIGLRLTVEEDGTVTPLFTFTHHGRDPEERAGQPFVLSDKPIEGSVYLGVDFGTCNSYVAKYFVPIKNIEQASYPEYQVSEDVRARLIRLDEKCAELVTAGLLTEEKILRHAENQELEFVFHSNKIEGNQLSKGQTESTLSGVTGAISKDQREAVNLRDTFSWVLEYRQSCADNLPLFAREVNSRLRSGIDKDAGEYRQKKVTIGGVSYVPPPSGSMDDYMSRLGEEIRETSKSTSPLELAVRAHTKFVAIHPFVDGNGRTARLIMAAILLASGLPIIVLNSDDKGRYLKALELSNQDGVKPGSLNSLLALFADLLEETLASFETKSDEIDGEEAPIAEGIDAQVQIDAEVKSSDKSTIEVVPEIAKEDANELLKPSKPSSGDAAQRLSEILRQKKKKLHAETGVAHPAWKSAFLLLQDLLSDYADDLDNMEDFKDAGYSLVYRKYDVLSEETFRAYWTRSEKSKKWFFELSLYNPPEKIGLMFQFGRSSNELISAVKGVAPVTCGVAIGGEHSGVWQDVKDEPISLREIGFVEGKLVYMNDSGKLLNADFSDIMSELISDMLIKS